MATFNHKFSKAETPEIQEQVVKETVRAILKEQQKEKWSEALARDYGIEKKKTTSVSKGKYVKLFTAFAVAASILLAIVFGPKFYSSNENTQELAFAYLIENPIEHPGVEKGTAAENQKKRQLAIASYDARQYDKAIEYFSEIPNKNTEDQFFLAIANLNAKKYPEAIILFQAVSTQTEVYNQEIAWFLGLSHLLNENTSEASSILSKINPGDWKYNEAQKLLGRME